MSPREPFHLACQLPVSNNVRGEHRAECKVWQSIMIAFPFKDAIPILCPVLVQRRERKVRKDFIG